MVAVIIIIIMVVLPMLREVDTVYPTDFNKKGWGAVEAGMTKSQVNQILGEPLYELEDHWQYGEGGSLGINWLQNIIGANLKRIYFGEDGKVSDKDPDFY